MSDTQIQQLVKMAQQIALNMAAEGDAQADKTAAHIHKFWTPAMRQRLVEHARASSEGLPPVVRKVVEFLDSNP